jgi:hypothetical protein
LRPLRHPLLFLIPQPLAIVERTLWCARLSRTRSVRVPEWMLWSARILVKSYQQCVERTRRPRICSFEGVSPSDFAFSASSSTSDLQSRSVYAVESRITRAVGFFIKIYTDRFGQRKSEQEKGMVGVRCMCFSGDRRMMNSGVEYIVRSICSVPGVRGKKIAVSRSSPIQWSLSVYRL